MSNTNTSSQIVQRAPTTVGGSTPQLGSVGYNPSNAIPQWTSRPPLMLTKFQFRKLFTLAERMAIDNIQYSSAPAQVKAAVNTMQLDLQVSGEVDLHLKDTNDGVRFLVSVGLLSPSRAIRILANLPPL